MNDSDNLKKAEETIADLTAQWVAQREYENTARRTTPNAIKAKIQNYLDGFSDPRFSIHGITERGLGRIIVKMTIEPTILKFSVYGKEMTIDARQTGRTAVIQEVFKGRYTGTEYKIEFLPYRVSLEISLVSFPGDMIEVMLRDNIENAYKYACREILQKAGILPLKSEGTEE